MLSTAEAEEPATLLTSSVYQSAVAIIDKMAKSMGSGIRGRDYSVNGMTATYDLMKRCRAAMELVDKDFRASAEAEDATTCERIDRDRFSPLEAEMGNLIADAAAFGTSI